MNRPSPGPPYPADLPVLAQALRMCALGGRFVPRAVYAESAHCPCWSLAPDTQRCVSGNAFNLAARACDPWGGDARERRSNLPGPSPMTSSGADPRHLAAGRSRVRSRPATSAADQPLPSVEPALDFADSEGPFEAKVLPAFDRAPLLGLPPLFAISFTGLLHVPVTN